MQEHLVGVGDPAPDMTLLDDEGRERDLSEFWLEQPIVLVFMRHYNCSHCRAHILQLRRDRRHLRAASLDVVLVGMGTPERATILKADLDIAFPVLCDTEKKAYQCYGLQRANPLAEARLSTVSNYMRDLRQAGGRTFTLGQDFIQLGGTFVICPDGVIRFAFRSLRIADRPETEDLIRAVQEN